MDFRRPMLAVTTALDGDVLAALARVDEEMTGERLHRVIGHGSAQGIRNAADRLAEQGILLKHTVGRAHLYRFNRAHIAAPGIEALAHARQSLYDRLRETVAGWKVKPVVAMVFGSVARGQATPDSDLDLLIIRADSVNGDDETWCEQLYELSGKATSWTGNDVRVLELVPSEVTAEEPAPVLLSALEEGVEIYGSRRALRQLLTQRQPA